MMQPHIEAWARYCATHKATPRRTLEYKIARREATLQLVPNGKRCVVCGGWLQVGYKSLVPTKDNPRVLTTEYIHTMPEWCARATEAARTKQSVIDAFESVDREQHAGAQFENILLAVSSRIALAWLDIDADAKEAPDGDD